MGTHPGPIGVFDSGVGGLGIFFELERALPGETLVYYADTLRCPWGSRSDTEIVELASAATETLIERGAKLIVVACNSATTHAIGALRARFGQPFVGTEPAVKPASEMSRTRKIGVMATSATVRSLSLQRLRERHATGVQVIPFACPDRLVELVEEGRVTGPEVENLLAPTVDRVRSESLDVLVLGCTHYVFLKPAIQALVGPSVQVIDTSAAVARQVARVLRERELVASPSASRRLELLCSGDERRFEQTAGDLRRVFDAMTRNGGA